MQESVQHFIPTTGSLDSHKSTLSRKSNFGDLLVSRDEVVELFLDGKHDDFLRLTQKYSICTIDSPIHGKPTYILREIIPIVKKFYLEQSSSSLA